MDSVAELLVNFELQSTGHVAVSRDNLSTLFPTVKLEQFLCVNSENVKGESKVIVIDMHNADHEPQVFPLRSTTVAAINPGHNVIALRDGKTFQVFNVEDKMRLLNTSMSDEELLFCDWLNSSTVGVVTDSAVYHCNIQKDKAHKEGDDNPKKVFSLKSKLAPSVTCVTNYSCDGDMKWSLVECQDDGMVTTGRMELYSVQHNTSRDIVGCLGRLVHYGSSLLLVYVLMSECGNKGRIVNSQVTDVMNNTVSPGEGGMSFTCHSDKPVALQVDSNHSIIYLLTAKGFLYLFDMESYSCLFNGPVSRQPVMSCVPRPVAGRLLFINDKGQVISISVNGRRLFDHVLMKLKDPELASNIAAKYGLPGVKEHKVIDSLAQSFQFPELLQQTTDACYTTTDYLRILELIASSNREQSLILAERLITARNEGEKPLVDVTDMCDWLLSMDYDMSIFRFVQKAVFNDSWLDKIIRDPDNRAKLLSCLESNVTITRGESKVEQVIARIHVMNGNGRAFMDTNANYNKAGLALMCENTDIQLAYELYDEAQCYKDFVQLCISNSEFTREAHFLIKHHENIDLWVYAIKDNYRTELFSAITDNVAKNVTDPTVLSTVIRTLMIVDVPSCLMILLDRVILDENSQFSENRNLQNLLILTAIKHHPPSVMKYITSLCHYDAQDIANICVTYKLYTEAIALYRTVGDKEKVLDVYIHHMNDFAGAQEFAEETNDSLIWSTLGRAQLKAHLTSDAILSMTRANDFGSYKEIIESYRNHDMQNFPEDVLINYLLMVHEQMCDDSLVKTQLALSLARNNQLTRLTEFLPNLTALEVNELTEQLNSLGLDEASKLLTSV